ncbi:hypothetical protein [Candidatus Solirubrobacter pratensis]|uniref:hypothetical protein n=1 Tax=Candidatus Solirubrobacter pratensis TaxID=1298857 RepID=UPI0004189644|nr:hypothetical protein [Candidatus Solirubrobacter pratensis]
MGPDAVKHLRNIAIIIVLAVAVWKLPGGGTGANTVGNVFSVIFIGGVGFLGFRIYMERRDTILGLEERQRGLLYGALALAAFALIATRRMWDAGGLGALIWLAMLGAAAYAIYSVWRAHTTY